MRVLANEWCLCACLFVFHIHLQKEEIAKEFDLPERQSKIATIMKHDGETYCLCRSSDSSRFMM